MLFQSTAVVQEPFLRLVQLGSMPVSHASVGAVLLVTDLLLTMKPTRTRTPLLVSIDVELPSTQLK